MVQEILGQKFRLSGSGVSIGPDRSAEERKRWRESRPSFSQQWQSPQAPVFPARANSDKNFLYPKFYNRGGRQGNGGWVQFGK